MFVRIRFICRFIWPSKKQFFTIVVETSAPIPGDKLNTRPWARAVATYSVDTRDDNNSNNGCVLRVYYFSRNILIKHGLKSAGHNT